MGKGEPVRRLSVSSGEDSVTDKINRVCTAVEGRACFERMIR